MIRAIIFDLIDLKPLLDHVLEVFQPENEEEMFLLMTEELGVAPEECVFIDDNQKSIDVAQSVGMQAILFENPEQLRDDLLAFHVTC